MAERGLLVGVRIAGGTVAAGVAAVVILLVGLVPLPMHGSAPRALTVDPAPADQVRVCTGSAMRLGDASGGDAGTAFALGSPSISADVVDGELDRARIASGDSTATDTEAPEVIRVPVVEDSAADDAVVGGAQIQDVDAPDFRGLAAASCAEPSGSIWLVGGAMTVGRSTLLLVANPTDVPARVGLEIFGEDGPVSAPGMAGIDVPAGGQRVLSLAGFAPGVASPVVHVTARGGRVVAVLQQSIVRGLDSVGVEFVGASPEPAGELVVPGVRITDGVGTSRASALADWQDVGPAVRIAVPGDTGGTVTVRVVPESTESTESTEGAEASGTSFEVDVEPGTVTDIPLDAGSEETDEENPGDEHGHGLADGGYTVFVESDVPVVAAVRTSTAVDMGAEAAAAPDAVLDGPPSDLAWFAAAQPLDGSALVVVPDGPSPAISIANPTTEDAEIELASQAAGAAPVLVTVPAGGSTTVAIEAGSYLVSGSADLTIAVSFAGPGLLTSFVVSPPRPVAGPVVVHPD